MTTRDRNIPCLACGAKGAARILYGLPLFSPELDALLDKGELVLGGCVISEDDPEWHCNSCGHDWAERKTNP